MCCLKLRPLLLAFLVIVFQVAIALFGSSPAAAQTLQLTQPTTFPTIVFTDGQQQIQAPDWSNISFDKLPPLEEAGWIEVPLALAKELGYNPSRVWKAGATVDKVLKLGDIAEAFHSEAFKLENISDLTGLAIENLNLKDFGLTSWQTPSSLVEAIPELGELSVSQVEPIRDLLSQVGAEAAWNEKIITIATDKVLGKLQLGEYLDLTQYGLNSIPELSKIPIYKFEAWQQSFIGEIPGLASIPLTQMPIPILGGIGKVAIHDLTWSAAEQGDEKIPVDLIISGSVNRKGKVEPVPCSPGKPCGYIELSDLLGANGSMYGKRWVSGKVQKVKGGFGPLRTLNSGWEPTGLLPYGTAFKVALLNTNESKGTASYGLYFRSCVNIPFYGKSCSPYFIGPVPWLPTKEQGLVIVASAARPDVDIPSKYQDQIDAIRQQYEPQVESKETGSTTLCGEGAGGVDFKALADATSSIEGNYNSIGRWGCDSAGNCGRGLGRYQFMTYRSDVKQAITSQPGGSEFYVRLASGYNPSTAELNRYFSPAVQDDLFVRAQTQNINYLTKRGASGDGLIACLGQMWYSGRCNNSNGRDYTGGPTIQQYGQVLLANYRKALQEGANQICSLASAGTNGGNATGKLINPAPGAPMTSDFGPRPSPCQGCSSYHKGIDIGIGNGTSVKSADGGTVVYAGSARGYGNVLIIDHGNGLQTRYAHLESFSVGVGTKVAQGQMVAKSDSTGVGTGAHLHFEVRENASPSKNPFDPSITAVDPEKYVKFN